MMERTPSAVSQWVSSGKIHGDALVGIGRAAKIDVDKAKAQLAGTLDLGQQLAQPAPVLPVSSAAPANDAAARKLEAVAELAEIERDRARAKDEADSGRWMETEVAQALWSAELARWVQNIETWMITDGASSVHAEVSAGRTSHRDIAMVLRDGFRDLRAKMAKKAASGPVQDTDDDAAPEEEAAA